MKKQISIATFTFVFVLLITQVFIPDSFGIPATVEAKYYNKVKTVSKDLNGDGKKETIKFVPSQKEYDMFGKLTVYINGKSAKTLKTEFYNYEYSFYTISSGKTFLYVHTSENNEDGYCHLYGYKGGKLSKVIDFQSVNGCRWVGKIKASGNKLTVSMTDSSASGLGATSFRSTYTYSGGKFKLDSKVHKIISYYSYETMESGVFELPVIKAFTIYSDKKCTKEIGTVPIGAKVKVTKAYLTGNWQNGMCSYYVTGDGYDGWYSGNEVGYEYLFEGVTGVA